MSHCEQIARYFEMWVSRDFEHLDGLFASDIYYSECNGPEFGGLHQVQKWIAHMLPRQMVKEWRIDKYIESENGRVSTVLWRFRASETEEYQFDGVFIIEFNDEQKISSIREYESKTEKYTPEFAR